LLILEAFLSYAVAMMAAGWDGSTGTAPGFPTDGSWVVKYEDSNQLFKENINCF